MKLNNQKPDPRQLHNRDGHWQDRTGDVVVGIGSIVLLVVWLIWGR